jgi:hypothetical protein
VKQQIKDKAKDRMGEDELEATIDGYEIPMDKEGIWAIKVDGENKLWKRYVRGKIIPKPYDAKDRWTAPWQKPLDGRVT